MGQKRTENLTRQQKNERRAMGVSAISIGINVALSVFKLTAGIVAHSGAMVSDAVHSASDVFSTFVVVIGVKLSGRKADRNHEYGHERLECVAAIILSVILCATGLGIGYSGLNGMISGNYADLAMPGALAMAAAVISIGVKEAMYWFTRAAAKKLNSSVLMADAWHHRSDALSSVGSFAGIAGARLGFKAADPIASVVICLFIIKAALDIFLNAARKLIDESCGEATESAMRKVILAQDGVRGIDLLRSRQFGSRIYLDVEIRADGDLSLWQSHGIAEAVHDAIEKNFEAVKHCMVHVNPVQLKEENRE